MSSLIILGIGVGVAYFIYKVTCNLVNKYSEDDLFNEAIKNALYGDDFNEKYIKEKYEIIKKAAETGDADAQLHIGRMYDRGIYLEKNTSKAKYWYNLSAEQGNAWALINLAILEEENDINKATELYKKSLKAGEIGAAYNLGILCRKKARRVYEKGNISVEEFTLNQALNYLRDGITISKPLYNSSYKDFLKYRYEIAVMIQKTMARIDTINKNKEHEEEAKKYADVASQCYTKMKELYGVDVRKMPEWDN